MKRLFSYLLIGVLSPLGDVEAQQPLVPSTQQEIAVSLSSDSIPVITMGIIAASQTPHQEWTAELRAAILYALEMEMWRDAEAIRLGIHRFTDDNLVGSLLPLAVVTRDPAAIPQLVLAAGNGSVRAALTEFGRQALPEMIRVVIEEGYSDVANCLIALRQMVQVRGADYFMDGERSSLNALVAQFLSPATPMIRPDWHPAIRALNLKLASQLALVLNDTQARGWVELLASDVEIYRAKSGTSHPKHYQKDLVAALNGAPMLPGPVPLSWYLESWREQGLHGMGFQRE